MRKVKKRYKVSKFEKLIYTLGNFFTCNFANLNSVFKSNSLSNKLRSWKTKERDSRTKKD